MKHDHDDLGVGRTETDVSLGKERAAADESFTQAVANAARQLDALITWDRVLADMGTARFRQCADDLLAGQRFASPEPSSQVAEERVAADDSKKAERCAMDSALEHERRHADERSETRREKGMPAHIQHQSQRDNTNEDLSAERSEADAVVADRATSDSALEVALNAEVGRARVFEMVTHDLRNPLCVIVGNADMIAEGADRTLTREAAADITRAAAHMGRLLTDLLDVARIDAESFPLDKRPHAVAALLSEMRQSYRSEFNRRGVTLSVDVPSADDVASFDHDRVVQMLSNLLGNAIKFTPRGGNVDLRVEHDANELVFVVRDDGVGIEPSAVPHLFERFWQRDADRRRGLGLGLYLCRTIARAHGGDISVHSVVGAGSTFRVSLPMS